MEQKSAHPGYTVTRKDGGFACKHHVMAEPELTTEGAVFRAANRVMGEYDNLYYAFAFIEGALNRHADSGEAMHETDIRGLAAIFGAMAGHSVAVSNDCHIESIIIDNLAHGDVHAAEKAV